MRQVVYIAAASIREHSRRKLIIVFVALSLLVTISQILLIANKDTGALLGPAQTLAALSFFGLLALVATLAVSMGNIGRPFSDGEAALVLARPVARWQFALGRLAASVGLVAGFCLLMAVEMQAVRVAYGETISAALWGHWAVQAYNLTVVAAITTLFSVFAASPVIAAVLAFLVDRFVGTVALFYRLTELGQLKGAAVSLVRAAWYVTPKQLTSPLLLGRLGRMAPDVREAVPAVNNSPGLVLWSVAYLLLIVAGTIIAVNRKEVRG